VGSQEQACQVVGDSPEEACQVAGDSPEEACQVAGDSLALACQVAGDSPEEACQVVGDSPEEACQVVEDNLALACQVAGDSPEEAYRAAGEAWHTCLLAWVIEGILGEPSCCNPFERSSLAVVLVPSCRKRHFGQSCSSVAGTCRRESILS